jgi:hypothetical protein
MLYSNIPERSSLILYHAWYYDPAERTHPKTRSPIEAASKKIS